MKKSRIILLSAILTMCHNLSGQIMSAAPYCQPVFDNNYNMFDNIKIKGSILSFGTMGTWIDTNSYRYYNTTTFPNFIKGDTASFQLNVYSVDDVEPTYFALWIDYNANNEFDSTELIMQNSNTIMALLPCLGAPVTPINKVITVPLTASSGSVRARLMRGVNQTDIYGPYDSAFSLQPCPVSTGGHLTYGCTYDFNINIVPNATGVQTPSLISSLEIYPNPAVNKVTVNCDLGGGTLTVVDIHGHAMHDFRMNQNNIDVSALPSGMYFLQFIKGQQVFNKSFLIKR